MSAEPQAHPVLTDGVAKALALLDAWADAPEGYFANVTLSDPDGTIEYAFLLWCGARRLKVATEEMSHPQVGEWTSFRASLGIGRDVALIGKTHELPQPHLGVRIEVGS